MEMEKTVALTSDKVRRPRKMFGTNFIQPRIHDWHVGQRVNHQYFGGGFVVEVGKVLFIVEFDRRTQANRDGGTGKQLLKRKQSFIGSMPIPMAVQA
jgi:hypothetical protein